MTPLKLELCIHYACRMNDHPWLASGAPIVGETFNDLVKDGLLCDTAFKQSPDQPAYVGTDKNKAFVEMLTQTPLPVAKWIDPRTQQTTALRSAFDPYSARQHPGGATLDATGMGARRL